MYQHQCIKCTVSYEDSDPDPYFCETCMVEKARIAMEVDTKFAGRISEPVEGALKQYDRLLRQKGGRFPSMQDIGISL